MHYASSEEIFSLVRQFEEKTLPAEKWTHAAHLTVALVYLSDHTPDETLCFLRSDIISYNLSVGGVNSPSRGYHETLTLFWVWLVMMYLVKKGGGRDLLSIANEMLESPLMSKDAPSRYYSKDLLFSTKARARWVEPDLRDLEFDE